MVFGKYSVCEKAILTFEKTSRVRVKEYLEKTTINIKG
jgi:hypothetical protein